MHIQDKNKFKNIKIYIEMKTKWDNKGNNF